MSRLLGVMVLGLMATLGCQQPAKTDTNAKPDPVVAASAEPAKAAAVAPLAAGEEPGCCDPTKGEPECDKAGAPAGECGCAKEPGKDCPHTAPADTGAAPCPCKDKGHEGCPHAAGADDKEGAPCPCKDKGHEGCPHAGS